MAVSSPSLPPPLPSLPVRSRAQSDACMVELLTTQRMYGVHVCLPLRLAPTEEDTRDAMPTGEDFTRSLGVLILKCEASSWIFGLR